MPEQYRMLRDKDPVARVRFAGGNEAYLVTRYEDVAAVLSDRTFTTAYAGSAVARSMAVGFDNILNNESAEHRRKRQKLTGQFTARKAEAMRSRLTEIADRLLDDMARAGSPADLRQSFAAPFPALVICELLGVPERDRQQFVKWAGLIVYMTDADADELIDAGEELAGYLTDLVRYRAKHPGTDLISALVHSERDDDALADGEVVSIAMVLVFASQQASVNQIINSTVALLEDRGKFEELRGNPSLHEAAVEELLRYVGPADTGVVRVPAEDIEVGGVLIPRGATVIVGLPSANRDERHFDQPNMLHLHRKNNDHVALGRGAHFCLGAALARVELQVALGRLVSHFPSLCLAIPFDQLYWRPGLLITGFQDIPICW
jgi:nocardicin N-oxygenase